jgi:hypothetical protein
MKQIYPDGRASTRMKDLKGKKIGLTKSLNIIKNDWWRITEEQGVSC